MRRIFGTLISFPFPTKPNHWQEYAPRHHPDQTTLKIITPRHHYCSHSFHQKMQVSIQQTAVVRPIKPPSDQHHVLALSHIDTDRNLHVILRYLRIYTAANSDQNANPFHVITTALSAALVHYYPFAGTLRRRHSDGRLELHCHVDDGVPVINATVDCELSQLVNYLDDAGIDGNFIEQLAPDPDPNEDLIRPITLQVTKLGCGGFVLGAAVHHAIGDGIGASLFFNAMAELSRGAGRITIDPIWDRVALLGPKNPGSMVYPIQELLGLDEDFAPYKGSGKRVVKEFFSIKEEWLDQLKGVLHGKSGLKFTTFEALGALIWRAKAKASKVPGDEKVTFAYSINIRKLLNPPLPTGYWGNGCVPMYVHLTANELLDQPIWKTIDLIRKSKYNVSDDYVCSFIQFQELHYGQGIIAGRRVSGFTDWRHLGHSTVDFGWAGPVAVVPLSRHLLGSNEPCFFLPGNEGIKVLVHLEEDDVPFFRTEMEKLTKMELDGFQSAL